jgi:hypothetical protein
MTQTFREKILAVFTWAASLLGLRGAAANRSCQGKRGAGPEGEPEIVEALSIYLGGNHDLTVLRSLAARHEDVFEDTILRYQVVVAGRRSELCELAIEMGYVRSWCQQTHSRSVTDRRKAFARIAAMAHCEPVRRVVGNIPLKAFEDPDEQIRLEAARILLASGEPMEIVQVFEGILLDTPGIRQTIGGELRRHASLLCETAIPRALRCLNPREVLRLLVSWQRALPLPDVQPLAAHRDPMVRLEVMRLLSFLPRTEENRAAILSGLGDERAEVSAAAATAARRLGIPIPNLPAADVANDWLGAMSHSCPELENT